jgi:hypothetical protein
MNKCQYEIQRKGDDVSALLDKIEELGPATSTMAGLLTAADKEKLDKLGISYNTTHYWNMMGGFIPKAGEIIIYSDYKKVTVDGKKVNIPGIKIGTGNAYVQDLAFIGEADSEALLSHIADAAAHTSSLEKQFWNNKLNVDDAAEVVNETLVLNRN